MSTFNSSHSHHTSSLTVGYTTCCISGSVCLSLSASRFLFISITMPLIIFVHISWLSRSASICMSICPSLCVSFYLFLFIIFSLSVIFVSLPLHLYYHLFLFYFPFFQNSFICNSISFFEHLSQRLWAAVAESICNSID